jgi:hypothetical protein
MFLTQESENIFRLCMPEENFSRDWLISKEQVVWFANIKNFYKEKSVFDGELTKTEYKEIDDKRRDACLSIKFKSAPKVNFDYKSFDGAAPEDGPFVLSIKNIEDQSWDHVDFSEDNSGLNFKELKNIIDAVSKNFNNKTCPYAGADSANFQVVTNYTHEDLLIKNPGKSELVVFQCEGKGSEGDYVEDYTKVYAANIKKNQFQQIFSGHDIGWLERKSLIDVDGDSIPEFIGSCGYIQTGIFKVYPQQKWIFCERER